MRVKPKHFVFIGAAVLAIVVWRVFFHSPAGRDAQQNTGQALRVVAGVVTTQNVPLYQFAAGTVQAFNTVTMRTRIDGQLDSVDFTEGQDVKEGDRLAQIDPRPYKAALDSALANLSKDQISLANAKRDLDRYHQTAAKGYSSAQQLDTQTATVNALVAAIQGDQALVENARVQLEYTTITAPISGRTGIRHVDRGNIVHASDATGLVTITQLQPISLIFTLPQDALPEITAAQAKGPLPVTALSRNGAVELGRGKLDLVDNQIDASTGTIRLKASFPNQNLALWPGQFVNVRLETGTLANALTVDSRVVQRGPNGSLAYAIRPDGTVEARPVETGQDYRGRVVIKKGLEAGNSVVVDGQLGLRPGAKVTIIPDDKPVQTGELEKPVQ